MCLAGAIEASPRAVPVTRGVPPNLLPQYKLAEGATFHCLNGQGSVPASRINDDYCDCSDGSDEPGGWGVQVIGAWRAVRRLPPAAPAPMAHIPAPACAAHTRRDVRLRQRQVLLPEQRVPQPRGRQRGRGRRRVR